MAAVVGRVFPGNSCCRVHATAAQGYGCVLHRDMDRIYLGPLDGRLLVVTPEPRRIVTLIPTGRTDVPYVAVCNDGRVMEFYETTGGGRWHILPPIPQGDL